MFTPSEYPKIFQSFPVAGEQKNFRIVGDRIHLTMLLVLPFFGMWMTLLSCQISRDLLDDPDACRDVYSQVPSLCRTTHPKTCQWNPWNCTIKNQSDQQWKFVCARNDSWECQFVIDDGKDEQTCTGSCNKDGGFSTSAIAGIAAFSFVIGICIFVIYCCHRRRRLRDTRSGVFREPNVNIPPVIPMPVTDGWFQRESIPQPVPVLMDPSSEGSLDGYGMPPTPPQPISLDGSNPTQPIDPQLLAEEL
jgi:hypothetical protein